jgi:hypothetical protein
MDFAGKRILFIGIGFYDYESAIIEELRRRGASVLYHLSLPAFAAHGPLTRLQRFETGMSRAIRAHQRRIVAAADGQRLDYVFVINGEHLDAAFLPTLREKHPEAEFIAYLWDSLKRFPQLMGCQARFDRVYTSDRGDSLAVPAFRFRPLFFRAHAPREAAEPAEAYDLSFVGWLHHDRVDYVTALARFADRHDLRVLFYLYTGIATYLRLRLSGRARFLHTRAMSYERNAQITDASRVIVDLPHPMQTGMTMRAIEAVGAGKKMITTARDVVHYDFYRPENILVVEPHAMVIDPGFLASAPVPVDAAIECRYSLAAWVSEVFEGGRGGVSHRGAEAPDRETDAEDGPMSPRGTRDAARPSRAPN